MGKEFKIFMGIMIILWTFIILNSIFNFLNHRIINNNFDCIAIGWERMAGENKKEEHCNCLYNSYKLTKNPFREFWDKLIYRPFEKGIKSEELLEVYNRCKD